MRIYLLIITLIVVTVFFFFKKEDVVEEISETEKQKIVKIKKILEQEFINQLRLSGFTEASRVVTLKAQVEGKVSSKYFDKGSSYKAGKQILLIDPEDKVAKLKEMEALLNQRKKEYEVAENLFEKGFRSEVKLSKSRTNFENALASYERSQVDLNNTKILMPFDSIVEESFVELGDYLKKGDPLAKIVDLDPIFININVSEREIKKIFLNQNAKAFIADKVYQGSVNYISKTSDPQTRNFRIQVKINNKRNEILSGLSSEVEIQLNAEKAFFIASSLISLDAQGRVGIKVVEEKKVRFLTAKIISDVGNGYWINFDQPIKNKEIFIITQGREYSLDGELVQTQIETND